MGLKGKFEWYNSLHQGGKKAITFSLRCSNMIQSETFDCAIIDGSDQQPPQIRRQLKMKPNDTLRFDFDTCGWDWCQGDFFAILGEKDKIAQRWDLNMKVYAVGECPECHGSHRCNNCNGKGYVEDHYSHTYSNCPTCNGTGICQTCYVPVRNGSSIGNVISGNQPMPNPNLSRERKINALKQRITELSAKIESVEWERRMMQLKDLDVSSRIAYNSQLQLKSRYEQQLIQAQYELEQLERMQSVSDII